MSALMTVSELARAVGGAAHGDGRVGFSSVSTDTRRRVSNSCSRL